MLNHVLNVNARNLAYARSLLADIPDEQICRQVHGIVNHAIWQIGHITVTADFVGSLMGLAPSLPQDWLPLFQVGSRPIADPSAYPPASDLLEAFEAVHVRLVDALRTADPAAFEKPVPNEKLRSIFPTIGDIVVSALTSHIALHLGQLGAWRRAIGLPSVLPM